MKIIYGIEGKSDNNTIFINEKDLSIPIGSDSYKHPINFLKKIQNEEIDEQKVFKKLGEEDFSLWWFIYPTIFPSINRVLNFIIQFEKAIEKYSPTEIQVVDEFEKFDIIQQICNLKKIKLYYSKKKLKIFSIKKISEQKMKKYYFSRILKTKTKKRLSMIYSKNKNFENLKEKLVFVTPTAYRRKNSTNDHIKNEYIQGKIMNQFKEMNYDILGIDVDYTFKGDSEVLKLRLNDPIEWIPLELFLEVNEINESSKIIKKFLKIINDKKFQSCFNFNKIDLWKFIKDDFMKLSYAPYLPLYLKLIEIFSKIFEKNKPKAIFFPYETGPISLALIIASQRNKVHTIGVQHGIIYENHPDYSHTIFQNESDKHGMIIPQKMLLFGEFSRNLLSELGYPKQNMQVIGNPEFFDLDKRIENFEMQSLYEKYGISKNKFVILFTTAKAQRYYKNTYGNIDYDEKIWEELIKNLGDNSDFFIILKPHPNENIEIYKQILKKYNPSNCKIINDNLFELIFVSSVIISIYSTTILDAICCKKPVIRVNFTNTKPTLPYDEYNVVHSCELDELIISVKELKSNSQKILELVKNGEEFTKLQYNVGEKHTKDIFNKILEF